MPKVTDNPHFRQRMIDAIADIPTGDNREARIQTAECRVAEWDEKIAQNMAELRQLAAQVKAHQQQASEIALIEMKCANDWVN